jgi:trehalose 6-phosphate synthase/phosphatase
MPLEIFKAYKQATERLFLLDYDGTLVNIKRTPKEAKPTEKALKILRALAKDPCNTIVIVSGRNHHDLEQWLGDLPLALIAEHGMLYRKSGQTWQTVADIDVSWKPLMLKIFETYTVQLPGTFIEIKSSTLAWHYRTATNLQDALIAKNQVVKIIEPIAVNLGLRIMIGNKVIEVQSDAMNKGLAIEQWLNAKHANFILAAGDDATDEDLFKAIPQTAYIVKIGPGPTNAQLRLDSPSKLLNLLYKFV